MALDTNSTLSQVFYLVENSFSKSFSLTQTTVIYGNGYYMKFYPQGSNIADTDSSFVSVTNRNTSQYLFIFVWFENLNSSKSLTGTVYAYAPLASYQPTITIKQVSYPSTTVSYILYNKEMQ